jgi:hypothetical protein
MDAHTDQSFNNLYQLNSDLKPHQLLDAVSVCLNKAESLTCIATTIDMETYTSDIVNNYLWALSDIVREAKWLYEKAMNNSGQL